MVFVLRRFTGVVAAAGCVPVATQNVLDAELQGLWEDVMVAVKLFS